MLSFNQQTKIYQIATPIEFVEQFKLSNTDFIVASKSCYETYFAKIISDCTVVFNSDYGIGEPTDEMIDALRNDFAKGNYQRIIAIGGGSVIDMAKILVLKSNDSTSDLFEKKQDLIKSKQLIAIPTTCGAGSEVSNISIAKLSNKKSKYGIANDALYPDCAIIMPMLLRNLPYFAFATSSIDALIHAMESFVSSKSNIYTSLFSTKAITMILDAIKQIEIKGQDHYKDLLGDFLVASNFAGIAFSNTGTGAVHAISYPLSGVYDVMHGQANYQFLCSVFQLYNDSKQKGKIDELNIILANCLNCEISDVYTTLQERLNVLLPINKLSDYGMTFDDIVIFANSVVINQQRLLKNSYIDITKQQIIKIYTDQF